MHKKNFIIPKNSKFALVGHGFHLDYLFKLFKKHNLTNPIIITHKKKFHQRDIKQLSDDEKLYKNVFRLNKQTKIFQINEINDNKTLKILKKNKVSHIFSCSSRFIFKKKILNKFKNRIFNIHPTQLPKEQGGGTFTYRILNSSFICCATIHMINKGIDTGEIILKSKNFSVKKNSIPRDYLIKTNFCYMAALNNFVNNILKGKSFLKITQKRTEATYFKRFYTDKMGLINWDWHGDEIEKFIRACSKPYSGAFTYILEKNKLFKVNLFKAKFKKNQKFNHPFLNGKIFYQDNKNIKIQVSQGFLDVSIKDTNLKKNKLIKGKCFFSSPFQLLDSKLSNLSVFKFKKI
tara:strand:+ start:1358 stop:2401 length:1044 start_codon:yes stop_codon:yes gene_type:complete